MATPSIGHLGVFLNEYNFEVDGHLDKAKVQHMAMLGAPAQPKDFGTLDLWAHKRLEEVPFMAIPFQAGNVELWNTDSYVFDLATAAEHSLKVEKDISGKARPGDGGEPFELLVNRYVGAGARLKFDPLHPLEMQAQANSIRVGDNRHKVTLKVVQGASGENFVPKALLQNGSRLIVLAHAFNSEFGQEYSTWSVSGGTKKKFMNKITNAPIQTSYQITADAARFSDGRIIEGKLFQETKNRLMEYVGVKGSAGNGITYLSDFINQGGSISEVTFRQIASLYDDISIGILAKEAYNINVWGSGGSSAQDGLDSQVFAPGVYFQFDFSGYKHTFNIELFDEQVLIGAIKSYNKDKVRVPELGNEPVYEIRTGDGGWELVTKIFEKYLYNSNVWMGAKEYGVVEGQFATGLSVNRPTVTSYRHPNMGILKVVKDESLNGGREANDLINPYMPTGYRLSSYIMIITPYDYSSKNIKTVRPVHLGAGTVDMTVINGRGATHPLFERTQGNMRIRQGANLKTGYAAYFETVPDTSIVIDPSMVLKLTPKHPTIPNFSF